MRVTTGMITRSMINNVNLNLNKMEKYQKQISTGKRINTPSDDPIGTGQLLNAKAAQRAQEQYSSNMEYAGGLLETVDGALAETNEVLQRIRELAVSASSDTLSDESMEAIADEVDQLIAELVQVGNTDYAGVYIFGGGKSTRPPFSITSQDGDARITAVQFVDPAFDATMLDETYQKRIGIAAGVTMDISAGRMTFHTDIDGSDNINAIFDQLITLREAMDAGDQDTVRGMLGGVDDMIDRVLSERAVVGAKTNRLESALSRSATYQENLTALISSLEDADYAEATIGYNTQQSVYEASLSVGAKIIQPSLLDFLK